MQKLLISTLWLIYFIFTQPSFLNAKDSYVASDSDVIKFLNLDIEFGTKWYGIYYTDEQDTQQKIGYRTSGVKYSNSDAFVRHIVVEDTTQFLYYEGGDNRAYESTERLIFNANSPFKLISSEENITRDNKNPKTATFVRNGRFVSQPYGKNQWFANKDTLYTLKDYYASTAWLAGTDRKKGDSVTTLSLKDKKVQLITTTIDVINSQIEGAKSDRYIEVLKTNYIKETTEPLLKKNSWKNGNVVRTSDEAANGLLINGVLEAEAMAKSGMSTKEFRALRNVNIDFRSHDALNLIRDDQLNWKNISQVTFEVIGEDDRVSVLPEYANHYTLSDQKNGKDYIIIGTRPEGYEPEKVQEGYYSEAKQYLSGNPILAEKSMEITKGAATQKEKVLAIRDWVRSNMKSKRTYENPTPYELLENLSGDCTEYATLFDALSRAAGIPSRKVSGYLGAYIRDGHKSFSGHQWNEVEQNGVWVPLDVLWDDERDVSLFHLRATENRLRDRFKLKLVSVEYKNYKKVFE